ncbi:unnamed protein product [Rhodiola kirilowii]
MMHAGRSGCHFNVKLACRPTGKLFTRSFPQALKQQRQRHMTKPEHIM